VEKETDKITTKQRILDSAVDLFALKGYTETTVRELSAVVGIKEASVYNHFPSKNAILEYILDEYAQIARPVHDPEKYSALKTNPTPSGILACMRIVFPPGKEEYYIKRLFVILQEQHRNPLVRKFVSEEIIHSTENVIMTIIGKLKDFGIIRPDADSDFWVKVHSSLIYAFANRSLLGIGDAVPEYSGMGMGDLLWNLYDKMLKECRAG